MPEGISLFTPEQWSSIRRAISQEITEAEKGETSAWLEIDGIKDLGSSPHGQKYRLLVANAPRLSAEQVLTFHVRGSGAITATVIEAKDQELVVICDKHLPPDARILRVSFDPTFIYRALERFLEAQATSSSCASPRMVGAGNELIQARLERFGADIA